MPRMDGMELLQRLRPKSDIPVIFLTSKEEEVDEVLALKVGADDLSQTLLTATAAERIKVLLRRATSKDSPGSKMPVENVLDRGE